MYYFILLFIAIIIVGLIGFTHFHFLSKTSKRKGNTRIKLKVILNKILHIEFESEFENNS